MQKFNPVELALSLLDPSSFGKDMDSFIQTKTRLHRALKGTIESTILSSPANN